MKRHAWLRRFQTQCALYDLKRRPSRTWRARALPLTRFAALISSVRRHARPKSETASAAPFVPRATFS